MNNIKFSLVAILGLLLFSSCGDDDEMNPMVDFGTAPALSITNGTVEVITEDMVRYHTLVFGELVTAVIVESETGVTLIDVAFSFGKAKMDLNAKDRLLKNQVSIGAAISLVQGVEGQITQTESDGSQSSDQSGWLSTDYYQDVNYNVLFGYNYNINRHLSIGLRANYQLVDLYKVGQASFEDAEPNKLFFE